MIYLDTNVLIRFFTKDDLAKAKKVKELLEKESEIFINDVVFPELDYVLRKVYSRKRSDVAAAFRFLLSFRAIKCSKIIHKATYLYETSNLDMADCLIVAQSLKGKLASFDEKLLKIKGVKPFWPTL
ncbi:hypothetical protein A3D78_04345 [Candidatus Gottesmanbacteria bacterium RIFCSPHIGHO2_02_FULL_39_14]|uniref:PIN domain-containing protein n=1 Tax=Candidatus Gottesmanbacteria bacterium RIFCSPHIGHO2_02_FULL_39_14 TaxID=1798383 RepID=A0A1F6A318_9BACT|nr:MAG: hypothetical protein A3D78_04345 [Candidatus Gottesmanbacteria bacterium RIFCSPHIGHO2_02_FULL_39_14]